MCEMEGGVRVRRFIEMITSLFLQSRVLMSTLG